MKKQPSAGAAAEADLSNVNRAFLSRLTEDTADRWIKATTQLFLSLNGEENGISLNGTYSYLWFIFLTNSSARRKDRRDRVQVLSGKSHACCPSDSLTMISEVCVDSDILVGIGLEAATLSEIVCQIC